MKSLPLWLGLLLVAPARGADWPQFRGPQAGGVDSSAAVPVRWDVEKKENLQWSAPVPGLGHASPIIWGDRIYITTASSVQPARAELKVGLYGNIEPVESEGPQQWRLMAIDRANGNVLWNKVAHEAMPRSKRHPKASHCNSTPATNGRFLVAIFGSEGLFCFDMEGKFLWKKDLGAMDAGYYSVKSAQWGFASSPVIHEDKIIVQCDVQTNSFLAAYDLLNGTELWRTPRHDVPSWSTPTVAVAGSRPIILVNGWHHTGGYELASGKEIWRLNGGGDIPVPTPVVARDLAYFTSGHGQLRPMRAIRLGATGDITPPTPGGTNGAIVWAHPRQGNYMQTPIVVGDNLFACFDIGLLTCFDARNGAIRFSERLGNGSEGFTSSPVSDGRNLFIASENGRVYVVPATNQFSVIATNTLGETCMASPAICAGTLYYRARDHVIAIGTRNNR